MNDGLYVILIVALYILLLAMSLFFIIILLYVQNKLMKSNAINEKRKIKTRWGIICVLYIFICIIVIGVLILMMF